MAVGLERGTYDAAVLTEPAHTYALKNNDVRCIANPDFAIASEFMIGGWVANRSFAEKNPEIVHRVVAVLEETARWANVHHSETRRIGSQTYQDRP